jgi:hypothetical protein
MNPTSVALLHRLMAMASTSLLQYVHEAVPWSTNSEQAAVDNVRHLAEEERDFIARLGRFLQKRHVGVPKLPSYPSHFTTVNYVSIEFVLPKLIAEIERELAILRGWLAAADEDEARAQLQHYADMKERQLQSLKESTSTKAPA